MKNIKIILAAICLTAFSLTGFTQIAGTAHDFTSGLSWTRVDTLSGGVSSVSEVCVVCHTPHNASTVTGAPLWNRAASTQTYTPYASGAGTTMQSTPSANLGATSKLCLSCHDGTVGLESFGGISTATNKITGTALLSNDLSNDHPISMTYDGTLVTNDGGLKAITASSGIGTGTIEDMLFGGQVECASCHDVHDAAGLDFFLVKANTGSALCLTCHVK